MWEVCLLLVLLEALVTPLAFSAPWLLAQASIAAGFVWGVWHHVEAPRPPNPPVEMKKPGAKRGSNSHRKAA
ncbi:MAG: hypothetical protein FJW39_30175 [Acidobacteria bacterium]|nr:hypothetical protein [Acidobacteriota bacterium]